MYSLAQPLISLAAITIPETRKPGSCLCLHHATHTLTLHFFVKSQNSQPNLTSPKPVIGHSGHFGDLRTGKLGS